MKMKNTPLVTIITSTYNAVNDIEDSIKSVISQSYANIQYVIIDGGSTDGTLEIIKKYEKYISIFISEKDSGIYDAWNKGLLLATGDWIAFLGADDIYLPDAILDYINHIEHSNIENLDYVSSKIELVDSDKKCLRVIGKEWKWNTFKRYMSTPHVGSLHSRLFFDKYGRYNIEYKIVGDYEMLLRANNSLKTSFLNSITVKMQVGGVSNQNKKAIIETYSAKINNKARTKILAKYDALIANFIYFGRNLLFNK